MTAVHPLDTPFSRVIGLLHGAKQRGDQWIARCPAHDDKTPSLRVKPGTDGRVLMKCQAGCPTEAIVSAVGLSMTDLFPPRPSTSHVGTYTPPRPIKAYDYVDENGCLLFQSVRYEPKDFRQRGPNGESSMKGIRLVPYRLPEILEAVASKRPVYVVEGEKDADALADYGYAATTNVGGAGKWKDEYSALIRDAEVVVLPDNDDAGRKHGDLVANSLHAHGCTVRVVALPGLPEKGDVSDWLNDGHDLDELGTLVGQTRIWTPDPMSKARWRLDELWANDVVMRPPPPVVARLAWLARSTLLASREKAGKSTLTGYLTAKVSTGGYVLGEPCRQGTVLVVGLEEFIGDAARRLRHFGADATRVYLVDKLPAPPERLAAIRGHIKATSPVLVIIDSLIAYGAGTVTDANASAQMGPVVQEITDLARDFGPAVILIHHATKASGRYRDSSAIGGAVDVIAEMYQDEKDRDADPTLRHFRVVGRVPAHGFACRFDGNDYRLDMGREAPPEQRIIEYVRDHPGCSANDAADHAGGNRQKVLSLITHMLNDGRLHALYGSNNRKLTVPAGQQANLTWNQGEPRGN